jgi:hypothetical protein
MMMSAPRFFRRLDEESALRSASTGRRCLPSKLIPPGYRIQAFPSLKISICDEDWRGIARRRIGRRLPAEPEHVQSRVTGRKMNTPER